MFEIQVFLFWVIIILSMKKLFKLIMYAVLLIVGVYSQAAVSPI